MRKPTLQKPIRNTTEAFIDAKYELKKVQGDDESYHSVFDTQLEERLSELDPEFMARMTDLYNRSKMSRWCA